MPMFRWMGRTCKSSLWLPATWPTCRRHTLFWVCHGECLSAPVHKVLGQAGQLGATAALVLQCVCSLAQVSITSGANSSHCLLRVAPLCTAASGSVLLLLRIKVVNYQGLKQLISHHCREAQRCFAEGAADQLVGNPGSKLHLRCIRSTQAGQPLQPLQQHEHSVPFCLSNFI